MNQYINVHLEIYVRLKQMCRIFGTGDIYVNITYTNTNN